VFDSRPFATMAVDGGVWVESATSRSTLGWLITPNITFGLNTTTNWIASVLEVAELDVAGNQVELWYSVDPAAIKDWQHPSWRLHQRATSPSQAGVESPWNGTSSRSVALQIRLIGDGTLDTPKVTRFAIRGFPKHRDRVIVLPIDVSDVVSVPGRARTHVPNYGYAIQDRLHKLLGANVEMEMLRFNDRYLGIIDRVSEPITVMSDRGSPTTVMLLEFRGQKAELVFVTGTGGVGIGTVGIAQTGTGVQNI